MTTTELARVHRTEGPGLCARPDCPLPMTHGAVCSAHSTYRPDGHRAVPAGEGHRQVDRRGLTRSLYWVDVDRLADHVALAPQLPPTGLCAASGPDRFFDLADTKEANRARVVCAGCPNLWPCLARAVRDNEEFGVWGGSSRAERVRLRRALSGRGLGW